MSQYILSHPWAASALSALPVLYAIRRWCDGGKCQNELRLDGKTAIITGANTGIGKETAIDLATRGATVVMACRDLDRSAEALAEVKDRSKNNNVFLRKLDLSSLESVRTFASSFTCVHNKLNILVNNAGVGACAYTKTEDGFEMQFGVNHLGHFALTNLLLPLMVESSPGSRIINVSSRAGQRSIDDIKFDDINSEKSYSRFGAYCQSKLANVLFTKELHRRLVGTGVTVYAVHPGVVLTEIGRHAQPVLWSAVKMLGPLVLKTPLQGAQTTIYCCVEEGIEHQSGKYFVDCDVMEGTSAKSNDQGLAEKLWELSERMTGVRYMVPTCHVK